MSKPIFNELTEKIITSTSANMPQSLLVTGINGVGLCTAAKYIAQLLGTNPIIILPEKDEKVDIEKGVISVGIVRHIFEDTRTKSTGKRVIIIDYAQKMTHQAQNAFLKVLEEPADDLYFILVSNAELKLLPTILSRVKKIKISPINQKQSEKLLDDLKVTDATKKSQLLFMANGLPAELTRLATDKDYFEKSSELMRDARQILQGKLYQKLLIAQKYKDDRQSALNLINCVIKILKHTIDEKPLSSTISRIDLILKTYERIEANGNIRICLAKMVV